MTLVIPAYNEEESLMPFYEETKRVEKLMPPGVAFDFLFVNDGSSDKTLDGLRKLNEMDTQVHYLSFSRNFGKEAAIYAGLENANGDYIVIMDADLQDPPALLPQMYQLVVNEGYDCIGSRRVSRSGEPALRSLFARVFYKLINKISKTEIVDGEVVN